MIQRRLGRDGPLVGAIGLGCMGLSEFYEPVSERDAIATIQRAMDCGMTMLDTSDMYGRGENERLVGRAIQGRRDRAFVATKGGLLRRHDDPDWRGRNGRPEYLREACDASLARLGLEVIDLYYLHRVDPEVAIEESVGALAELVAAGKFAVLVSRKSTSIRCTAPRQSPRSAPCRASTRSFRATSKRTACSTSARTRHRLRGLRSTRPRDARRRAPSAAALGEGDVRRRVRDSIPNIATEHQSR